MQCEMVIPNAYPAVVSQELFDRAQERLERNKRAPAAAKAKVDYLLTTILYCGKCETFMVGESGTNKTTKICNYYCITKMLMYLQEREDNALLLLRKEFKDTKKGLKNIADTI